MKIEDVRSLAKEKGLSEKRITMLIAELHPDENGELSAEEYTQAVWSIDYVVASIKHIKLCLETTKAIRNRRNDPKKKKAVNNIED